MTRAAALAMVMSFVVCGAAGAQAPDDRLPAGGARQDGRGFPPRESRPGLERLARTIQRNLGIDDAKAGRLREVSARYAARRRALGSAERDARRTLREELARGDGAEQTRVARAIDALLDAQRRRVALRAEEQRDLAAFLTPVQRARFLALQERAVRAAQRARQRRGEPRGDEPGDGRRGGRGVRPDVE